MIASKLLLSKYQNGILSLLLKNNRIEEISYSSNSDNGKIGDIYVAKVLNVVKNINAAFLDYQKGKRGYLPISSKYVPVLLNRTYDGRILAGDEILVQMEKEAIREKEPVFTMNLSLAGKYSVITNANTTKSVSSKLGKQDRERLRECIPSECEYGIVIRTNAKELLQRGDLSALETECSQLIMQMDKLLREGIHRTCYSQIYQAPASYFTELRDHTSWEYEQIVTDDEMIYHEVEGFLTTYMPEKKAQLTLYQDETVTLHKLYGIETKIQELLQTKVWLNSGAYLVIEQTEAMYVIDVNSGKNITKKPTDSYILLINMEAAREIMRQIHLRNLSGIILVDFINMEEDSMKEQLMQELKKLARLDRIPTTIVDMTALGLVEITRKKTKRSLKAQLNLS
ncbi:MAG: ribonuclease E/G [Lachnospiraceae bacterium]|nr:ribonuclease E/G [Lachnospiraceae bacterium]